MTGPGAVPKAAISRSIILAHWLIRPVVPAARHEKGQAWPVPARLGVRRIRCRGFGHRHHRRHPVGGRRVLRSGHHGSDRDVRQGGAVHVLYLRGPLGGVLQLDHAQGFVA